MISVQEDRNHRRTTSILENTWTICYLVSALALLTILGCQSECLELSIHGKSLIVTNFSIHGNYQSIESVVLSGGFSSTYNFASMPSNSLDTRRRFFHRRHRSGAWAYLSYGFLGFFLRPLNTLQKKSCQWFSPAMVGR